VVIGINLGVFQTSLLKLPFINIEMPIGHGILIVTPHVLLVQDLLKMIVDLVSEVTL